MTTPFTKHRPLPQVCAPALLCLGPTSPSRSTLPLAPVVSVPLPAHTGHYPPALLRPNTNAWGNGENEWVFFVHRATCSSRGPLINQSSAPSSRVFVTVFRFGKGRFLLIPTSLSPTDPIQGGGPAQRKDVHAKMKLSSISRTPRPPPLRSYYTIDAGLCRY
ncbi:hypothetical protein B0H13DRAFT_2275041, partial [Mycena leptocephala]